MQVRLKTRYGQYLRANGGPRPWRNSVTHDVPHRTATANWILWDVDLVELRPQDPNNNRRQRPTPIAMPDRSLNSFSNPLDPSHSPSIHSPLLPDNGSCAGIEQKSPTPIEVCSMHVIFLVMR